MKISICITCKGRLHHLRETLPRNVEDNAGWADLQFVILDYNSSDGLEEWARDALRPHLAVGRVVYYRERSATQFLHAHAKNVVHGLADGDVLCNLDADGITGKDCASLIAETFGREGKDIIVRVADYVGALALTREAFRSLRGYDEDFIYGWGYEDDDLYARARLRGLRAVTVVPTGCSKIEHSDQERRQFIPGKEETFISQGIHEFLSQEKLKQGAVVRNEGRKAGSAVVFRNFAEDPILAGS